MKSIYRIEWYGLVKPEDCLVPYCTNAWHMHELLNENGSYELIYKGKYIMIEDRLSKVNKLLVNRAVENERYEKKFPLMRRLGLGYEEYI